MTVRVTLPPAAAKAAGNPANEAIDVQLGAGATAGDLLRELSDRLGPPFAPSLHGSGVDAGLRMFVNGLLALDDSDPLTTEGHEAHQREDHDRDERGHEGREYEQRVGHSWPALVSSVKESAIGDV